LQRIIMKNGLDSQGNIGNPPLPIWWF